MKQLLLVFTAFLALSAALPNKPAQNRESGEIAANSGRDREIKLEPLKVDHVPAVATLKCPAGATPTARISCITPGESRESLRF